MKRSVLLLTFVLLLAACTTPRPPSAPHVTLVADGTSTPVSLDAPSATVRDVLEQARVTLNDLDRVRPSENVAIADGMTITVTRIIQRTETQTQTVSFSHQTVRDASVPFGQSRVLQPGRNGILEITFRLTFEDGAQTERVETRREVLEQPTPEVVLVGVESALGATPITGTIAYLANNNAYVLRQSTGNRRALTTSGDLDGRVFALSPDGKWLLFTRALTNTQEDEPLNALWVVDTVLANAAPKPLKTPAMSTSAMGTSGVIYAGWSPDSASNSGSIAYSTATMSANQPGWRAANDLWLAAFRNGSLLTPEQLIEPFTGGPFGWWGATYEWSPNGKWIAIGSTDSVSVVDVDRRKRTTLASFSAYNTFSNWAWTPTATWTPDSKFVIATVHGPSPSGDPTDASPVFNIMSLAADGSFKARLASETGMWAAPRASSAVTVGIVLGRAQAPYASADSRYDLFRIDRDGSNRARLFPAEDKPGIAGKPDLAFSPDGTHIIVAYQRDLYLVNVSTGESQQLSTEGNLTSPRWSR